VGRATRGSDRDEATITNASSIEGALVIAASSRSECRPKAGPTAASVFSVASVLRSSVPP